MKLFLKTGAVGLFGLLASALPVLAQADQTSPQPSAGGGIAGAISGLITLDIVVLVLAGMWKVFTKAGEPGWAVIVPIYNLIVLLKIAGKPVWWIILLIIPFVNFIILILVALGVAKAFGKGAGFGIGLAFLGPIFYPILGFGDAKYVGAGAGAAA
jgi:hypothetical protein